MSSGVFSRRPPSDGAFPTSFYDGDKSWLDNLKFRFSAGTLGNGNVDPYSYLELMNVAKTSILLDGDFRRIPVCPR